MMKWLKRLVVLLVFLALVGFGGAWLMGRGNNGDVKFRTAKVTRGEILSTIGSTGTVEPEEVIDVGAQVAGQIAAFGKDADGNSVDHGSRVKADGLLAQIDDSLFRSDVAVAEAQVAASKAGVQRAEADLKQYQARKDQAERDWTRAQTLGPSEALAQFSYDTYKANFESAVAQVAVSEASIAQAKGGVAQAEAQLFRAQRNLGYTTIKSPIDGVIIERRVNIGQTVVSSLNAPSLFLLAKDLTHMQVWVSVNEADIGRIHPDQPVTFTVDTFPNRTFKGTVKKVRPKAEMSQNVVTYLVEVSTDNQDGTLWPYLTANVKFEVSKRENVLSVPNAALRYTPADEHIAPDARPPKEEAEKEAKPAGEARQSGRRKRGGDSSSQPSSRPSQEGEFRQATIWVRDGDFAKPIQVRAGLSDGIVTEVKGDGVKEDMDIIIGEETEASRAASGSTNPFGPPQFGRPGGGRRSGG